MLSDVFMDKESTTCQLCLLHDGFWAYFTTQESDVVFCTFCGAWAVFISPYQSEEASSHSFPWAVLLSTLPIHQTALLISHQQDTVYGERKAWQSRYLQTHFAFSGKCQGNVWLSCLSWAGGGGSSHLKEKTSLHQQAPTSACTEQTRRFCALLPALYLRDTAQSG